METLKLVTQLLVQLVIIIPLVLALIKFIIKSIKEKNWSKMIELTLKLMIEAEEKFSIGAEKEEVCCKSCNDCSKRN